MSPIILYIVHVLLQISYTERLHQIHEPILKQFTAHYISYTFALFYVFINFIALKRLKNKTMNIVSNVYECWVIRPSIKQSEFAKTFECAIYPILKGFYGLCGCYDSIILFAVLANHTEIIQARCHFRYF